MILPRKEGWPSDPPLRLLMPHRSWRHRAEYALVRAMETIVSTLPEGAADRLGAGLGMLVHSPLGIRLETVRTNLRTAFPDAPDEWIGRVARDTFRHLGREAVAMMRLSRLSPGEVLRRTEIPDWEEMERARAEGRGVILATGHFGNWEIAAASIAARGVPITAIVKPQRNRRVDARLNALRGGLGVETVSQRDAPRKVPRILRRGGVLGIVADQDARRSGIFVPFFGRPSSTYRGPALFALRLNAAIFACSARRLPGPAGRYEIIMERARIPRSGDLEADVHHLTAELAARLETTIRATPEQYFWFHKRWKTAPPPELATPVFGTTVPDGGIK